MKMSLVVFGALAVSFLLRRRSAALRHWVLAAGVAGAAAVPVLTAVVPAWPLPFATPTAFRAYQDPFVESTSGGGARESATRTTGAANAPAPRRPSPFRFGLETLQSMWIAGTLVALAILLTGLLRLASIAANAHRVTHGRWFDLAQEISHRYGLRRPIVLLQSHHPSLLVTWGLANPKVILPIAADRWTDERARVVLSHELAHICRGDWVVQLSAELLRAFYWFNPLVWIACRRLRLESEHACDDEVMSRGVDGTDYATHLIDLARSLNRQRHSFFPAPAMARPSSLERRVRAMLTSSVDRTSISARTRAAVVVLLLAFTAVVAAAQSGFVTFTGTISDDFARGIPNTTVTLTSEARQAKYEVKTNASGRFEFVGLPAGEYGIEVKGNGFQVTRDTVAVSGQNLQRNYTLRLGTLQETIKVVDDGRDPKPSAIRERAPAPRAECVASAGGQIRPPKKLRDFAPTYPPSLRGTGTNGVVVLKARIGLDGYLTDIAVEGEAHPEFASAAVVAVREWMFSETLLNCEPVVVGMTITVTFTGTPRL
ncbi:MAG TPA: M56 family metallopeptidase [Vicinamibacterales bacterium]|nr:M56 family metallopeptidase [Vicinamibacterales bacterium]